MIKRTSNSQGFTIVELMIATAVFAVLLLVITSGMIQVGRLFYKGTTSAATQEIARTILEDISQAIQFSGDPVILSSAAVPNRFCVGSRRYTFAQGTRLTNSNHAMLVDKLATNCNDATPANNLASPAAGSRELMGLNMRLSEIVITKGLNETYAIKVMVAYGDNSVLEDLDGNGTLESCRNEKSSSQFCSVSQLSTTVKRRLE